MALKAFNTACVTFCISLQQCNLSVLALKLKSREIDLNNAICPGEIDALPTTAFDENVRTAAARVQGVQLPAASTATNARNHVVHVLPTHMSSGLFTFNMAP